MCKTKSKTGGTQRFGVNGVTFYLYGVVMNEDVEEYLADFSKTAEDCSYTVYRDGENLVVY